MVDQHDLCKSARKRDKGDNAEQDHRDQNALADGCIGDLLPFSLAFRHIFVRAAVFIVPPADLAAERRDQDQR